MTDMIGFLASMGNIKNENNFTLGLCNGGKYREEIVHDLFLGELQWDVLDNQLPLIVWEVLDVNFPQLKAAFHAIAQSSCLLLLFESLLLLSF